MNERTMRDRFHAMGPMVLRVGVALVLLQDGVQRTAAIFQQDATPAVQTAAVAPSQTVASATSDGVRFSADWNSLLGMAEGAAALVLLVGVVTRLVVLPILVALGYSLFVGIPQLSLTANTTAMWLLAAACLSLLVSGGGCLALRRRRPHRHSTTSQPVQTQAVETRDFVHARTPLPHRVRNWFAQWRAPLPPAQASPAATPRRWRWGRCTPG